MQAVEAPLLKLVAIGGLALISTAAVAARHHHHHRMNHRLSLHAPVRADAIYLTVFADGAIQIARDDSSLRALTFTTRAFITDGCEWMGIERLEPVDAHSYSYSYDESILQCAPDAVPAIKTPRRGVVTVDE